MAGNQFRMVASSVYLIIEENNLPPKVKYVNILPRVSLVRKT